MYVLFCCYLLDVCTGFFPASSSYISTSCGTLEEHGMHGPMSHFSHLAIQFERTQTWIYTVSQPQLMCLFDNIVKIWQHCMQ
jgi:hypothetical protein